MNLTSYALSINDAGYLFSPSKLKADSLSKDPPLICGRIPVNHFEI
jgi:hypothetical protein